MTEIAPVTPADDAWRQTHLGRLLGHAMRRFDARVLQLMARDLEVPLALSNLAARDKVGAAHIHITRHLSLAGDRLTDLAEKAGMSKQAMADLVAQCEAWGSGDARNRRARCARKAGALHAKRAGMAQSLSRCRRAGTGRI